ncbi:kinase domain protein [Penicillium fimorum]|uniref:Autophagy-related protein 1 n=1 Tax=Penicillium fimorum TaxID=1882269 RepID=A0A9W9Y3A3_9EURO|nr:kinase domain protein [Penicillium fimorum]
MKELEVLRQFQRYPGIVHLAGIVICTNPYKTDPARERPKVVSGFLLEFWDLGSLEQILESGHISKYFNWRARMVQIGEALIHMHESHWSHLDLKPSNIVMDSNGHAAIIDIGSSCGFTWE